MNVLVWAPLSVVLLLLRLGLVFGWLWRFRAILTLGLRAFGGTLALLGSFRVLSGGALLLHFPLLSQRAIAFLLLRLLLPLLLLELTALL